MRPVPPPSSKPASGRPAPGPAWLSRALVVSTAVWLVLFGASVGASFLLVRSALEIREQRYLELGFSRSTFILLERAADLGVYRGALTALGYLIGMTLVSAYAPVRLLYDPRELAELLATKDRLLRAQVAVALAFLAATLVLANSGSGLAPAGVYLLGGSAVFGIVALDRIARPLRGAGRAAGADAKAHAFAATAACAVVAVLAHEALGRRLEPPYAWDDAAAAVLLAVGAVGTFVFTRRAVRAAQRTHAPAGRSALGKPAVRFLLLFLLAPALAPLAVRVAASAFGRSGIRARTGLNVIVVGVDSLRADAVDLAEPAPGGRDRTPNLRKLAQRGIRFTHAVAQSSESFAACASLLTGRYPLEHGAVAEGGRLPRREVTLAEVLREAGYDTGSFVTAPEVAGPRGFGQGVDEFSGRHIGSPDAITSQSVTNQAMWFVERHAGRPFFLFAQYTDPRHAWRDHAGWGWADEYAGWLRKSATLDELVHERERLEPADRQWLRDLHDEEVAFTDSEIGRLVDAVQRAGLAERTLFVVVGSQGQELLDHGSFGSGHTLYDELVRVPLVVVLPRGAESGTLRADVVETRGLFATVLDRLGVEFEPPPGSRPWIELADDGPGSAAPAGGEVRVEDRGGAHATGRAFSMLARWDSPVAAPGVRLASLSTARWKLVRDVSRDRLELYDLAADPAEQAAVAKIHEDLLEPLRAELEAWIAEQEARAAGTADARRTTD